MCELLLDAASRLLVAVRRELDSAECEKQRSKSARATCFFSGTSNKADLGVCIHNLGI
jgi:hypothetical protein